MFVAYIQVNMLTFSFWFWVFQKLSRVSIPTLLPLSASQRWIIYKPCDSKFQPLFQDLVCQCSVPLTSFYKQSTLNLEYTAFIEAARPPAKAVVPTGPNVGFFVCVNLFDCVLVLLSNSFLHYHIRKPFSKGFL